MHCYRNLFINNNTYCDKIKYQDFLEEDNLSTTLKIDSPITALLFIFPVNNIINEKWPKVVCRLFPRKQDKNKSAAGREPRTLEKRKASQGDIRRMLLSSWSQNCSPRCVSLWNSKNKRQSYLTRQSLRESSSYSVVVQLGSAAVTSHRGTDIRTNYCPVSSSSISITDKPWQLWQKWVGQEVSPTMEFNEQLALLAKFLGAKWKHFLNVLLHSNSVVGPRVPEATLLQNKCNNPQPILIILRITLNSRELQSGKSNNNTGHDLL